MLKVAIVGCGKIADAHAAQILRLPGCEIVGVYDREPLMAQQLYERFSVKRAFAELGSLLTDAKPDVVHITTPADSHFPIARLCLEQGCHVYVEKPFTLDLSEARQLIAIAESKRLKLTVGHSDQFTHVARRMRELVKSGYLGNAPIHMESDYGYDLGDPHYAKILLGDKHHWIRKLPGQLLQNVISHGIARIAEFLMCDYPRVIAHGFTSPFLRRLKEREIIDELRVMISEDQGTTAYFTFSSQMRPSVHEFRLYGSRNGLIVDQDHEILLLRRGHKFKSYAETFISPISSAKQYLGNFVGNVKLFMARDFHMESGLKYLLDAFYHSISHGTPVPIPYREILLTSRIMDSIFEQVAGDRLHEELASQPPSLHSSQVVRPTGTPTGPQPYQSKQ